jgi:hypothetical protein
MPKGKDRTDYDRLRGMGEDAIDYSDIPLLNDPAWLTSKPQPQSAYHVVPTGTSWSIRRSGGQKGLALFASKAAAVRAARASARKERTILVVHGRDGSVREYVSFTAESA